jgi:hypothetical protein
MTVTWREDEPRMTAADLRAAVLPLALWGRRGYDKAAVDEILGLAVDELIRLVNERTGLIAEAERLRRVIANLQGGGVWLSGTEEAHAAAVTLYSKMQVTVDGMVADAQDYCARLTGDAAERREAMLAEAEQVLDGARAQARDAADAALDEPVPAQAAGPLRAARAAGAYDRTFNGVYLNHVSLLVDTLQQMLSDWKQKELGGGHEPAGQDTPPAPRETAIARKEHL